MKKILTFSLMALMALFAVSCSQDDEVALTPEEQDLANADDAYMAVRIQDVSDAATRATTSPGFEYGTEAERKINSVRFFFFNSNGQYLKEGLVFKDGGGTTGTEENIEYIDNKLVLVVNIEGNVPEYVVTVINPPVGLSAGATLDDLLANLQNNYYIEGTSGGVTTKYFTMATSSYFDDSSDATASSDERRINNRYFVTKCKDFFVRSAAQAQAENAIVCNIYVERLAVKVGVDINTDTSNGSTLVPTTSTATTATNVYKLLNSDDNTQSVKMTALAGESAKDQDVYIKLRGWGINAVAKKTYLIKHLDNTWGNMIAGWSWNFPSLHRSYWGMSYNYGDGNFQYPTNYNTTVVESNDKQLRYIKGDEIDNGFGSEVDYCNENNNKPSILSKSYSSATTSVLVLGQICKEDGTEFNENIVKYADNLYTYNGYCNYVVDALTSSGSLTAYTMQADGTARLINYNDVEVISASDKLNGRIYVQLKEGGNATWYSDQAMTNQISREEINTELKSFNLSSDALGCTKGWMYYSIPIEHLGASNDVADLSTVEEGYFGVIRNHYYKLTINALTGVGHGIFDPEEPIVPNPVKDEGYYLNAKINILSWKLVNQSVSLK